MPFYLIDVTRRTTHVVEARTEGEARATLLSDVNKVDEQTVGYSIEEIQHQ